MKTDRLFNFLPAMALVVGGLATLVVLGLAS